jgi:hypothetical protein
MDELVKKLKQMKELTAEAGKTLETLSQPATQPSTRTGVQKPEQPVKPTFQPSKKDPKKVAEQLKNPDSKKMAMDGIKTKANLLKFNDLGQWGLHSEDELDIASPVNL